MKRAAGLFERIVEWDNLRLAFYRAKRGKLGRPEVEEFAADLEGHLQRMSWELRSGEFRLGRSTRFTIHDPKRRIITAPAFPERVLHHAIMNVCEPHFERFLIADTFACRRGKGRIAALHRARHFSRCHRFALKLDMRRYFDSISHRMLRERLARRFKDPALLAWFGRIIRGHESAAGRGPAALAEKTLAWKTRKKSGAFGPSEDSFGAPAANDPTPTSLAFTYLREFPQSFSTAPCNPKPTEN